MARQRRQPRRTSGFIAGLGHASNLNNLRGRLGFATGRTVLRAVNVIRNRRGMAPIVVRGTWNNPAATRKPKRSGSTWGNSSIVRNGEPRTRLLLPGTVSVMSSGLPDTGRGTGRPGGASGGGRSRGGRNGTPPNGLTTAQRPRRSRASAQPTRSPDPVPAVTEPSGGATVNDSFLTETPTSDLEYVTGLRTLAAGIGQTSHELEEYRAVLVEQAGMDASVTEALGRAAEALATAASEVGNAVIDFMTAYRSIIETAAERRVPGNTFFTGEVE